MLVTLDDKRVRDPETTLRFSELLESHRKAVTLMLIVDYTKGYRFI